MKILVTGSAGFIGGYLVEELLQRRSRGHRPRQFLQVRPRSSSNRLQHPAYRFVQGDAKDVGLLGELMRDVDQVVAGAARIGGISYFHEFAYDLLAENERLTAAVFDAAIAAHKQRHAEEDQRHQLVDGLRERDGLADAGRRAAPLPAAALDLRLPEAGDGILRPGGLGAIRAAVHDHPAVQLRRHRRTAGAVREGGPERQRPAWP